MNTVYVTDAVKDLSMIYVKKNINYISLIVH